MSNHLSVFSCIVNCEPVGNTPAGSEVPVDVPESFGAIVDRVSKQFEGKSYSRQNGGGAETDFSSQQFDSAGVVIRDSFPFPLEHTIFGSAGLPAEFNEREILGENAIPGTADTDATALLNSNTESNTEFAVEQVGHPKLVETPLATRLESVHQWSDAEFLPTQPLPTEQVALVVQAAGKSSFSVETTLDSAGKNLSLPAKATTDLRLESASLESAEAESRLGDGRTSLDAMEVLVQQPLNVWSQSAELSSAETLAKRPVTASAGSVNIEVVTPEQATQIDRRSVAIDRNSETTSGGDPISNLVAEQPKVDSRKATVESAIQGSQDLVEPEPSVVSGKTGSELNQDSSESSVIVSSLNQPENRLRIDRPVDPSANGVSNSINQVRQPAGEVTQPSAMANAPHAEQFQATESGQRPVQNRRAPVPLDVQADAVVDPEPESSESLNQDVDSEKIQPGDAPNATRENTASTSGVIPPVRVDSQPNRRKTSLESVIGDDNDVLGETESSTSLSEVEAVDPASGRELPTAESHLGGEFGGDHQSQADVVQFAGDSVGNQAMSTEGRMDTGTLENRMATEVSSDVVEVEMSETLGDRLTEEILHEASRPESIKKTSQTVRDAMASSLRLEGKTVQVELHPAELGALKIQVTQHEDSLEAQIIASESMTSDLLNTHREQLMQTLSELGFESTDVNIIHEDDSRGEFEQRRDQPETPYQSKPKTQPAQNHSVASNGGVNIVA